MYGVTREDVTLFLSRLEVGDLEAAVDQTMALFATGITVDALVAGLLAPAQRVVGERWQAGAWTVAQEHQASAAVDACLSALGAAEPLLRRPDRDWVVVAGVEGEWHALAPRMIAESLRYHGWKVRFLGASVSPERLRGVLEERPRAAALSCSMTSALPGAARCVDVLAAADVPVVVGGAAFGNDASRAIRLGAAAWAPDSLQVAPVLEALTTTAMARPRRSVVPDYERLDVVRAEIAHAAVDSLWLRWPSLAAASESDMVAIHTHAELMVGALVAAALVDDRGILAEFAEWLDAVRPAPGAHYPPAEYVLHALADVVVPDLPSARRIFDFAAERVAPGVTCAEGTRSYHHEMASSGAPDSPDDAGAPRDAHRFEATADAIRARARSASDRVAAVAAGSDVDDRVDPLERLRQQAQQLLAGVGNGGRAAAPATPLHLAAGEPAAAPGSDAVAGAGARAAQVVEAARAQAARLLDEAESDANQIRAAARVDAERIRAEAQAAAAEVMERAETESLEWLAEAGREVARHLDEIEAEAARIMATARAEAARVTADATRTHAELTANAAEVVRQAQQDAERQLSQTTTGVNALLAKARSDAAAILADAQAERTRLAEETERLASSAAELLELRLNEAEAARAEALELRAAADAALEADTRRLLGEAQADCDRIIAEARAEAEMILAAAARGEVHGIDLRDGSASAPANISVPDVAEFEGKDARRRRFRP